MRPAAALVYLASVARVAAIELNFPSGKSTSSFIDVNPVSVGDGILTQFEKNSLDVLCFGHGRQLDFE